MIPGTPLALSLRRCTLLARIPLQGARAEQQGYGHAHAPWLRPSWRAKCGFVHAAYVGAQSPTRKGGLASRPDPIGAILWCLCLGSRGSS
ncbi:hypothetical protein BCR44DRAFT_1426296 [Catenaria anguillulae PL171]|uniref:Uncharacterized protein n=1 Tax=Catenaria anguillulae PL171 TaxID=765915 RepID=A0A1Y2I005_9FUNG|nr:hypothetical protein BCR44DRAFT_1426296 [Catenaria anguillulae PL171]